MRKIYAFLAAALISVCAFASKEVVPTDAVLSDYYTPGNVCVCFFVPADMACNNIILTGSFNSWSDNTANCIACEPVDGYDGWYVAEYEPEATPDAEKGLQAKPIMLNEDGSFNWQYQVGTATAIRGGVTVVAGQYAGQIDLINYGTDAPNVFTVDSWLNNPCDAVYHNYRIVVISDGCDGFVVPYIAGSMNGWAFARMQVDQAATVANEAPTYYYTFKGAEGVDEYQLGSSSMNEQGDIVDTADWKNAAYLQELKDGEWDRINGGNNFKTGTEAEVVYDIRNDNLRWARCAPDESEEVVVILTAPAGAPAEGVDVIGSFGEGWSAGTLMTLGADGKYTATVQMQGSDEFKFRKAGDWAVQIQEYGDYDDNGTTVTGWHNMGNLKVSDWWDASTPKKIEIELNDADTYRWTPTEQGIENVVLTEKAQKVIVDGVMYIIRDNKMYNAQGTQVR